jgi:hypothetical protein
MALTLPKTAVPPNSSVLLWKQLMRNRTRVTFELTVVLLFGLAIWFRAFWPVPIGLPDNGDFPKVLGRINAWPVGSQEGEKFDYLVTDYAIDGNRYWDSQVPTLEWPLARIAKVIAGVMLPPGQFDLRILGAIHASILILAVWLVLRTFRSFSWKWSFAFAAITVLIFADVEYLQFLNTAYMDASAVTLLVLLFAVALTILGKRSESHWLSAAVFSILAALFLSTKLQHQFCAFPLAFFCFYLGLHATDRKTRLAWFSGILLLFGTSFWMIRHRLPDYQADSGFSLVFMKLLPLSQSPQQALQELDRPGSDIQYMGMHAWSSGSPMADNQYRDRFWHDVSALKIIQFYWRHPGIASVILWRDLLKAGSDIPVSEVEVGLEQRTSRQYGIYRKSDHPQPHTRPAMFSPWSDLRRFIASKIPLFIPVLYLICTVVGIYKICQWPHSAILRRWPLLLLIVLMGMLSYLAGSLGDATDTARHIIAYQVATDLMILFLLYQIPGRATTTHQAEAQSVDYRSRN